MIVAWLFNGTQDLLSHIKTELSLIKCWAKMIWRKKTWPRLGNLGSRWMCLTMSQHLSVCRNSVIFCDKNKLENVPSER